MGGLLGIIAGVVVAVILSPFIFKLARRWHRGTAAVAAGSVAGGAVGEGGIGAYITRLRTGRDPDESTSSDTTDFDTDVSSADGADSPD